LIAQEIRLQQQRSRTTYADWRLPPTVRRRHQD